MCLTVGSINYDHQRSYICSVKCKNLWGMMRHASLNLLGAICSALVVLLATVHSQASLSPLFEGEQRTESTTQQATVYQGFKNHQRIWSLFSQIIEKHELVFSTPWSFSDISRICRTFFKRLCLLTWNSKNYASIRPTSSQVRKLKNCDHECYMHYTVKLKSIRRKC